MQISMYSLSVPVLDRTLGNLQNILDKAAAYAAEKKIEPDALLNARLHPEMYPLTRQVQLACDFGGKACARFAQAELPSMPDTETTFAQLKVRIEKVLANIKALPAAKYEGAEKRDITFNIGPDKTMTLTGQQFLNHSAFPNFFFHCATAYDILRHNGVELGKRDFLGVA